MNFGDSLRRFSLRRFGRGLVLLLFIVGSTVPAAVLADDDGDKNNGVVACPCKIAPIPDLRNKELTARWMVHSLNWGVLSTISSRLQDDNPIPFGNVYSFVDGTCTNSTGTPYFYGTYMDQSFADSLQNTNAALTLSEASLSSACLDTTTSSSDDSQEDAVVKRKACQIGSRFGDPENPVCARLTLTGKFVEVTDSVEKDWAIQAIYSRHESMTKWPKNHNWVVGKLVLKDIWLIDFFGGASILKLEDYYAANDCMTSSNAAILDDKQ